MILASLRAGGPDGTLVVISRDRTRFAAPAHGPRTMREAMDSWDSVADGLRSDFTELDDPATGSPTSSAIFASPLPRTYHWAEGSCYLQHMERIRAGRGEALPMDHVNRPIVYQSGGDENLPPVGEFTLPDPGWELDLEATIVVVTGPIARGADPDAAERAIRLVGLTNDLTFRRLLVEERKQGTGTYVSKPGRAFAPFVVTPDTLGDLWKGSRLHARTSCAINGTPLGAPWADRDLSFGFPTIIAHLATSRSLGPGSIVGTGTVSNADPGAGHACIAERRAVEIVQDGAASTPFLKAGDTAVVDAIDDDGQSLFGRIHQTVIPA